MANPPPLRITGCGGALDACEQTFDTVVAGLPTPVDCSSEGAFSAAKASYITCLSTVSTTAASSSDFVCLGAASTKVTQAALVPCPSEDNFPPPFLPQPPSQPPPFPQAATLSCAEVDACVSTFESAEDAASDCTEWNLARSNYASCLNDIAAEAPSTDCGTIATQKLTEAGFLLCPVIESTESTPSTMGWCGWLAIGAITRYI